MTIECFNFFLWKLSQKCSVNFGILPIHLTHMQQCNGTTAHSRMEHYFFSYLLTCEAYLMEVLEIMAQILQYIAFLSLKSKEVSSGFILNYLKKSCRGRHHI